MSKVKKYSQKTKRESQKELLEKYSVLVKRIAHHLLGRLPPNVLVDDLIQAGMIGLLEAHEKYDNTKGASFETYAGIRIRGAMLDDIRRGDWVPRSVHRHNRAINQAIVELERILNREPLDAEVAKHLEMTSEQYHKVLADINGSKLIGIEDLGISDDVLVVEGDTKEKSLFQQVTDDLFRKALIESIKTLPEREALVLSLYYDEEFNLKEIGKTLGVSESRVSQILSQSVNRLKIKLNTWTNNN